MPARRWVGLIWLCAGKDFGALVFCKGALSDSDDFILPRLRGRGAKPWICP